jgi:adenosylcobinamide amidohydrolase
MFATQGPQSEFGKFGTTTDDVVVLCLADYERIEFQKAAERCGLSLAAWIRDRLKECAKREAKEG